MAAPPPAPAPPVPPPVPEIPHLILGSLRYTLAWDVVASAFLLLVWFFGGRLESYWLSFATGDGVGATLRRHDDPGVATRRPPPRRRNARLRQLLAVWRASEEEVTSLCGADARDYLVVQRLLFLTLAAAAAPGACLLLPVAVSLSAADASAPAHGDETVAKRATLFDDASLFAKTTVHHFPNKSPYLWLVVIVSVVATCAVETASDAVERHRRKICARRDGGDANVHENNTDEVTRLDEDEEEEEQQDASSSSRAETATLLLRRLPRAVTRNPESLRRVLDLTFGIDRLYAVVVPRDGAETKARRAIGRARRRLAATRTKIEEERAVNESAFGVNALIPFVQRSPIGQTSERGDERNHGERAVALALSASLDTEDDLRSLLQLRRTKGAFVPNPGCAFLVFKNARAANIARRALQPTVRGACLASLAPATPDWLIEKLAPGGSCERIRKRARARFGRLEDTEEEEATLDATRAADVSSSSLISSDADENEPRAIRLAIRHGVHFWRCDPAPPPSGVLWENVGVAPGRRFLLTLTVNTSVFLGLVFVSSPLALFSYAGELANNLDPQVDWRWDAWLAWARRAGGFYGGLVFQFLPNTISLVMIYLVIPRVLEFTTRLEKHLTRSGALRSLVSKEFSFFLVNLLLLLALGKAALSAAVEQIRECQWHATPDACEHKFVEILGGSFVAEAAMSLFGFLCTCTTLGPAWELLSVFAWGREAAADRVFARRAEETRSAETEREASAFGESRGGEERFSSSPRDDAPRDTRGQYIRRAALTNSFANAVPAPEEDGRLFSGEIKTLRASPDQILARRRRSPRRPTFDLPGQHAFNATVLACAVTFASLAPALLLPGTLFFAVRYLVHKHNLLCLHLDKIAGAGDDDLFGPTETSERDSLETDVFSRRLASDTLPSNARENDGRLLATVRNVIRVSSLIHATVMAAFLRLRGTEAQGAAAFFLLVVVVSRRRVARLVTRFKKRFIDVRAGSRLNREDIETDASLSERLLGDARNDGNGDARGATDAPPETLREAKKKYRGPSDDADDAAHELV
jgi:hypothetical protein